MTTTYIIQCHTFYGRRYCLTIAKLLPVQITVYVSRTHILQSGLTPLGTLTDFVTRFSERK